MSRFVDKKFSSFESYLRKHFKEECEKFNDFSRVYAIDHDAFFAFYLKILLEKLENIKKEAYPTVSAAVDRKLEPGTRSSIPYPKDGLAAMKSGTIPELNLHAMVKETLSYAIDTFYKAVSKDKDLIKELEEVDTDTVPLQELYTVLTTPKDNVLIPNVVSIPFNILDYLKEDDAKFIYPQIRENMKAFHENVVVTLINNSPDVSMEDIVIQYGILPVMYTDPYIPEGFIKDFNNGNGVGIRVSDKNKYHTLQSRTYAFCIMYPEYKSTFLDDQQLVIIAKHTTT